MPPNAVPRVFCASLATETNVFSPLRTDFSDFASSFYAPPGEHPATPTLCSAVFPALRQRQEEGACRLIEGSAAWAEPGGILNAATWARLRDEVLGQLRAALPVDAVVLGLHGAMVADGCDDCESELIAAVRELVGKEAVIGASFDPHSDLTASIVEDADVITVFKEFPHTDFVRAGEDCVRLTLAAARGEIAPEISVFDARMLDVFPTSRQPMRSYVDKMLALEKEGAALCVSLFHGFLAGDAPAARLGRELYALRGQTRQTLLPAARALEQATGQGAEGGKPVLIADVWDNPGGGTSGDSTVLARLVLESGVEGAALGPLWDPMAVQLCRAAGEGARLPLRFGGKTSQVSPSAASAPIDAEVEVRKITDNAVQRFGDYVVPLGNAACIRLGGLEVVLSSNRCQAFSPDLFRALGVEPETKRLLVVKSFNHFRAAFAPIVSEILYAEVDGIYPSDPKQTHYRKLKRPVWPIVEDPWAEEPNGQEEGTSP